MKDSLDKALELINNTDGTNPSKYLVLIQDRFLEFIIYCAVFIQDYMQRPLFSKKRVKLDKLSIHYTN